MNIHSKRALALLGTEIVLAASFLYSGAAGLRGVATAAPLEDDPGWSCITNGDRRCGPGNSNGVPPGCYDDAGMLVAPWPCVVIVNPDGTSDVYVGEEHRGTGALPGPAA